MLEIPREVMVALLAMQIKRIAFDLDEVLFRTWEGNRVLAEKAGLVVPNPNDFFLGMQRGIFAPMHDQAALNGHFRDLDIYEDIVQVAKVLHQRGYGVDYVTHRKTLTGNRQIHELIMQDTVSSLQSHGLPNPEKAVFASGTKEVHCAALGADLIFEDQPHNCYDLAGRQNCEGRRMLPILVRRPWNENSPYPYWVECPSQLLPYLAGPS